MYTHNYCQHTKIFQIGQCVLNRCLFFTVPICVKNNFQKHVRPQLNYRPILSLDFQRYAEIFCDLFSTYSETCWPECNDGLKVTKNETLRVQHRKKHLIKKNLLKYSTR